jgi:hypothetical protein
MDGHRSLAQGVKIANHILVAHILAHVVALAMNHLFQRPPHAFTSCNVGMAYRNDEINHEQIGNIQNAFVGFLNMYRYPFGSKTQRSDGKVNQETSVGKPVRKMGFLLSSTP